MSQPPFDAALLDRLMDEAGLDVILASSKHNVAYMLGGYRFFFFDYLDAIGTSRYLPFMIYEKGRPERTTYIANTMESYEKELGRFWTPHVKTAAWTTAQAVKLAAEHVAELGGKARRIGVETAFLPAEAMTMLQDALPDAKFADALYTLERLRARKSPEELALLRTASERVVESMQAVIAGHGAGTTKAELARSLRREEVARDLNFEYCLVTTGRSHNRSPSDAKWEQGEILSLDSGGNYGGYIGDLCRMAILGEPDAELVDLLGHVEEIQQTARKPIRAGALGQSVYDAVAGLVGGSPHRGYMSFVGHGMGLITHEAPRLTSSGPVPYAGVDAERPLEAGMVLSIETTILHPKRGFIKLEDTVAVTADGYEAFGDTARGWNRGGSH